ncbi:hypothetical protein [Aridibaculum aurantiacum]|uniref:hypothetical protein n=1 Tax=Aridibaculum aurantiacum TaxID=2810307 RepID=UPI001A96E567|nr:hypothetical protein [Aridibaculum aurantiacum]
MKPFITLSVVIGLLASCVSPQEKAAKAYDEGVALAKQAEATKEKGDAQAALALSKQSLDKLNEAKQHDSTHAGLHTAMAHSYFVAGQHAEAMSQYKIANAKEGEKAANYREMGLIKLIQGELSEGHDLLDKAVALDHSKDMIDEINKGVVQVGEKSFQNGEEVKAKGDKETAKKHYSYAMNVMMLAYYYDNNRKDVAEKIAKYADEYGDYTIKVQYTKLSQQ